MSNEKEILEGVQSQIASFDSKASILLSVVGIIFALTLSLLDVFHADFYINNNQVFKFWYSFLFIVYIIITILTIIFLISVIIPRNHKKGKKYPNHYKDIITYSDEELTKDIKKYESNENLIVDQIKINANICNQKHIFLKMGAILLVPFVLCIFAMIIMVMFA